jgi:hypothetical protein
MDTTFGTWGLETWRGKIDQVESTLSTSKRAVQASNGKPVGELEVVLVVHSPVVYPGSGWTWMALGRPNLTTLQ